MTGSPTDKPVAASPVTGRLPSAGGECGRVCVDARPVFWPLLLLVLVLTPTMALAAGRTLSFDSGTRRVTVVELYTSEGCSSCPPAEAYLNGFAARPDLWTGYVPLAFHVDYWDYLGWRDRFAAPENGARQRRYVALGRMSAVYTPAFVVNGRGWRPARRDAAPASDGAPAPRLRARVAGARVVVTLSNGAAVPRPLELHLAVLGMGLHSHIRAGENRGRDATHDFVVLARTRHAGADGRWSTPLPAVPAVAARRYALAVWVSRPGDPTPLQATGGYIPVSLVGGNR
jgi:hypothetical protein